MKTKLSLLLVPALLAFAGCAETSAPNGAATTAQGPSIDKPAVARSIRQEAEQEIIRILGEDNKNGPANQLAYMQSNQKNMDTLSYDLNPQWELLRITQMQGISLNGRQRNELEDLFNREASQLAALK